MRPSMDNVDKLKFVLGSSLRSKVDKKKDDIEDKRYKKYICPLIPVHQNTLSI